MSQIMLEFGILYKYERDLLKNRYDNIMSKVRTHFRLEGRSVSSLFHNSLMSYALPVALIANKGRQHTSWCV